MRPNLKEIPFLACNGLVGSASVFLCCGGERGANVFRIAQAQASHPLRRELPPPFHLHERGLVICKLFPVPPTTVSTDYGIEIRRNDRIV